MKQPVLAVTAVLVLAGPLSGQAVRARTSGGALVERYTFGAGLSYSGVTEFSLPLVVDLQWTRWGSLTLSGGFASVSLTSANSASWPDQSVSGVLDTEARLSLNLVPDRVSLLATASLPTGIEALDVEEQQVLTVITTEVLGFSSTNLGSGGNVGGGLAAALPAGEMALGVAGSYTHSVAYRPVIGSEQEVKPGAELRLRAGLEGPVGTDGYLRLAGLVAVRGKDQLDGAESGAVGNRYSAYLSLDQRLGNASLALYAFDAFRSGPQIEATALGSALLPKGNVFALGAQYTLPVARDARLTPRVEFRHSQRAPDATTEAMERVGTSLRVGVDFRRPVGRTRDVVLEASGLFGSVVDSGESVGVSGFRLGVHLQNR